MIPPPMSAADASQAKRGAENPSPVLTYGEIIRSSLELVAKANRGIPGRNCAVHSANSAGSATSGSQLTVVGGNDVCCGQAAVTLRIRKAGIEINVSREPPIDNNADHVLVRVPRW